MNFPHSRPITFFCLTLTLLFLSLGSSCDKTPPPAPPDPKAELAASLKGAKTDGFEFATEENANEVTTSLTTSAARDTITLQGDITMPIRYTSIKDKKANTTKLYKTEAVKAGRTVSIVVTDLTTGAVVSKDDFPVAQPAPEGEKFDSLSACIKDFDCKHRGELQCKANSTCKDQFAALTCCLTNGLCFSVHLIIRPTSLRCIILGTFPDQLELAVSN